MDPTEPPVDAMEAQRRGDECVELGQYEESARWYVRAADAAIEPGDVSLRVGLLEKASRSFTKLGRLDDARGCLERAVLAHGSVMTIDAARTMYQLASSHDAGGNFKEAFEWFDRAANVCRFLVAGTVDHELAGKCLHMSAFCAARLGNGADALARLEQGIATKQQGDARGRVDHESIGQSLNLWGDLCVQYRMLDDAIDRYTRAVAAKEKGDLDGRVDSTSVGLSLHMCGLAHVKASRLDDALTWFERAVPIAEKGVAAQSLFHCGRCRAFLSRYGEAIPWLERAAEALMQPDGAGRVDHDTVGTCWQLVGDCCRNIDETARAIAAYERALAERERGDKNGVVYPDTVGESLDSLGYCHLKAGAYEMAIGYLQRAVECLLRAAKEGVISADDVAGTITRLAEAQAHLATRATPT